MTEDSEETVTTKETIQTEEGTLRIELEEAGQKVVRHDFYLGGKKVTKRRALAVLDQHRRATAPPQPPPPATVTELITELEKRARSEDDFGSSHAYEEAAELARGLLRPADES